MKLVTFILSASIATHCVAQTSPIKKPTVDTPRVKSYDSTNIKIIRAANNTFAILKAKKLIVKY